MNTVLVVLGVTNLITVHSYTIQYYDCNNVDKVHTYKLNSVCSQNSNSNNNTETFTMLQKRTISKLTGYSCKVTESRFRFYCGAYSHLKLATPPEIETTYAVTASTCMGMITSSTFTTPSGHRVPIKLGHENVIHSNNAGVIQISSDKVACQGQSERIGNNVVEDYILDVSQHKVLVTKEKFIISGTRIETESDHTLLPNICTVDRHGCQTGQGTYAWYLPANQCDLEVIRTTTMMKEGDYLVDEDNRIIIKKMDPLPAPVKCPNTLIYTTEYTDIYLASDPTGFPALSGDLNFEDFVRGRDDFLGYYLEKKLLGQNQLIKQTMCQNNLNQDNDKIIKLKDNLMSLRNGDTVQLFKCKPKEGQVMERKECFDAIPILPEGYVKIESRVYTASANIKECNRHFPLKIKTKQSWIELNPQIKKIAEPEDLPGEPADVHLDMTQGGIYTPEELESWRRHLELGDLHNAISTSIAHGVCIGNNLCETTPGSQQTPYSLSALQLPNLQLSIWSIIDEHIKTYGTYISIVVILIEAARFLSFLAMFSQTLIVDGVLAAKALLYLVCCSTYRQTQKVQKRRRKQKETTTYEEMALQETKDHLGPDV